MRILDKYIIKNLVKTYFFILLIFVGLYFMVDIFSNLSRVLKYRTPLSILSQYYLYSTPLILLRVSPISLLISTLYIFGELNKNNEIISIRASGLSILKLAFPVICFALVASTAMFLVQEKMLINSQKKVEDIKAQFMEKRITSDVVEKNLAFTSGDMILFAQSFSPKEETLQNVIIFQENENKIITKKILCQKIIYEYGFWIGKDIIEYNLDEKGNITDIPIVLSTKKIDLQEKPNELVYKKSIFSQFSSLSKLRQEMNRLKKIKAEKLLANLTIDYHQKIAEPFSHLFLVIGILPLALEIKKRKVGLSSLGVGFIFGFIYFTLGSFSVALGKSGIILPLFSAWLAPLFFVTVGISGLLLIR